VVLEMKDLLEYAKEHPDYVVLEPKFDALAKLRSLYSRTVRRGSRGKVSNLEMRAALSHIKFDKTAATKDAVSLEKVVEACNFMLAIYHREQLRRFAEADRRAILHSMSRKARQVYGDFHEALGDRGIRKRLKLAPGTLGIIRSPRRSTHSVTCLSAR